MSISKNKSKVPPVYNEEDQIISDIADGVIDNLVSSSGDPHEVFDEYVLQKCLRIFSNERRYKDHLNRGYHALMNELYNTINQK